MANITRSKATNLGNQGSVVYDISNEITTLTYFKALILDMAMRRKFESSTSYRFQWDETDLTGVQDAINFTGGYNETATSIVVDDASLYSKKTTARILRTGEVFQVSDITIATNTLTIIRGVGESAGVAIVDNDVIEILGTANEESSTAPAANMANTTTRHNFLQTFRTVCGLSGTQARTQGTPGMNMSELAVKKGEELLRAIEGSFIWGKIDENTTDFTDIRHTTDGALNIITTNTTAVGGTLTETAWRTFLVEQAFSKGGDKKMFFCGDKFFTCLSKWGDSFYRTTFENEKMGVSVAVYVAPTGQELQIVKHPLFIGDALKTGLGIVIDPDSLGVRYSGNPTGTNNLTYPTGRIQFNPNVLATATDAINQEWFAEIGLEMRDEQKHAVISGVTGPA